MGQDLERQAKELASHTADLVKAMPFHKKHTENTVEAIQFKRILRILL